jgi:agmatine deiminase
MKFNDTLTNTVYFSEFFKFRFPMIFEPSKTNLEANGINVKLIKGNQNIWCRDYMPVQVQSGFIRFGYKGYGTGYEDYPWLIVPEKCFEPFRPLIEVSDLILDGGGIVRNEKYAIITEKIFQDNRRSHEDKTSEEIHQRKLIERIERLLGVEVIIVPMEPGDTLGHTDGMCKFFMENELLINDYSSVFDELPEYRDFSDHLYKKLSEKVGLTFFPYAYEECPVLDDKEFYDKYPMADDNNPGFGYYINFLLTKSCILAPVFGIEKDLAVINLLKRCYPNHSIIAIDCRELSMEGGLSNCTTWNIIEM